MREAGDLGSITGDLILLAGLYFGGDIPEAIHAADRIGDDILQRNAGRMVQPHMFQHGTSEQRQRWFLTGYETAEMSACDTFSTDD